MSGEFDPKRPVDARDYSRRTLLANERTYLAWWRTGITSIAAGVATARLVPELSGVKHHWPYEVLGVGFAIIGLVCFGYGHLRRVHVDSAVKRGEFAELSNTVTLVITVAGVVLAAGLVALILAAG